MDQLKQFQQYIGKMSDLRHAIEVLSWDIKTKAPKNAMEAHIGALTTLSTEHFKMETSDEMKDYIDFFTTTENLKVLDEVTTKTVLHLKKEYNRNKNVPESLYGKYVALTNKAETVWEGAKANNDFKGFSPYLEEMVALTKEMSEYIDATKKPYDVLLDTYEEGITTEKIETLFKELKEGVVPLVEAIKERKRFDDTKLLGEFNKYDQKKLGEYLLNIIGYDFNSGRLDESEHPFTIGSAPYDVRVTTNYQANDLRSSIFSVLHEGGHGIYEQNIDPKLIGTPLATGASMGIHESQSRFYENIIGRNIHFWEPIYNQIEQIFPSYKAVDLNTFYRGVNAVEPSLIRTEADELTYNLHIVLRFEIEKALFNNEITVKDLPEVWRDKMVHYLGVVPKTDSEGVLQDIHWAGGAFGYFPSYALGNIYGGQFLAQLEKEVGNLDMLLKEGSLGLIKDWLKTNIHQYGSMKKPSEIIQNVCGTGIDAKPILNYYNNKYKKIYGI